MANTTAPLSEIAVANFAATILDDIRLSSLDDPSPLGRFMADNFGFCRDEVLRAFPWPFAKKRAQLAEDGQGLLPLFGWSYSYTLPSDCLRILELRCDGYHDMPYKPAYEVEGRQVLCNVSGPLPAVYIRRVTNMAEWDPLAARVLGAYLAQLASQRVTGKTSYYEKATQALELARFHASHVASLEGGTPESQLRDDIFNVRAAGL